MLFSQQFWPKVGFGIGGCSAQYMELAKCLMKQYYGLVPLGEVCCSTNWMAQQLDIGFYGFGCPHPAGECLVTQLNHLLWHYECATVVGRLLQVSMASLIIKISLSGQPYQVDFESYNSRVTNSWLKSVWEKYSSLALRLKCKRWKWHLHEREMNAYVGAGLTGVWCSRIITNKLGPNSSTGAIFLGYNGRKRKCLGQEVLG